MLQAITNLPKRVRKLLAVITSRDYRDAFLRARVAPAIEHAALLGSMSYATVVDIGANRGQFALVARHCYPAAHIVAFEPLAKPAARFRNVFASDPQVTLHEIAIGPATCAATMHVSAADDSSSLLPITELQNCLFSGTHEITTAAIQVDSLSNRINGDDLRSPALLKIDVQGYELPVLRGCDSLLSRFSHVYVECSFVELYAGQALAAEVIDYLYDHGFGLRGVYNVHYDANGSAIQADMLFAARNR